MLNMPIYWALMAHRKQPVRPVVYRFSFLKVQRAHNHDHYDETDQKDGKIHNPEPHLASLIFPPELGIERAGDAFNRNQYQLQKAQGNHFGLDGLIG